MTRRNPFDFTAAISRLCDDIALRTPELAHVRMPQVAVSYAQARRRVLHGLQAKLTPLRFEQGSLVTYRGRSSWTVRRVFRGDVEILYILTFYLPRFLDQTLDEKLITVFHELFHISPRFDGDIRRMDGRYHVHSHSQKEYDRDMARLARRYLAQCPDDRLWGFLRHTFDELAAQHGGVVGVRIPTPKLVRLPDRQSA
jgi:predicted metallopeptidase